METAREVRDEVMPIREQPQGALAILQRDAVPHPVRHAAPVAGLSDFTMPGEQDCNKFLIKMTSENLIYGYSVIPNGVNFIWYSSATYDYTSPQIYNDAADCGGLLWMSPYLDTLVQYPPEGQLKHVRHVQPLVQYDLRGSRPVHRYMKEYGRTFKGGDKHTRATLYHKQRSLLVYLVNDGPRSAKTSFSVKLPQSWKKCLVLNAAEPIWTEERPSRGRLTLRRLDCSHGPLPLIIRPYPQKTELVWHDHVCRSVELRASGKKVTISGMGVAGACGACFVYVPPGKAIACAGRIMELISNRIYIVQLVFNNQGRAFVQLDILPQPPQRKEWQWPPLDQ